MRISIALATYNGEKYLAEQLDSLLLQSLLPSECVICDDGSTDGTLEILRNFAQKAPFTVHIHSNPTRLGYRENFLYCASLCTGEFVGFCDQDDVWLPTKLQRVAEAIEHHPHLSLVVHQGQVVDAQLRPTGQHYPQVARAQTQAKLTGEPFVNIPGFAMVFKRELLHACPWDHRPSDPNTYDLPAAHDTWILFIAEVLGDVVFMPESLVLYRRHDNNTTVHAVKQRQTGTGLAQRIRDKLARMRLRYQQRAGLFEECANLLLDLSQRSTPATNDDLRAGSARYRRFADIYARRSRIYDPESFLAQRLAVLRQLWAEQAYARWEDGGVSAQALSKDVRYVLFAGI